MWKLRNRLINTRHMFLRYTTCKKRTDRLKTAGTDTGYYLPLKNQKDAHYTHK